MLRSPYKMDWSLEKSPKLKKFLTAGAATPFSVSEELNGVE